MISPVISAKQTNVGDGASLMSDPGISTENNVIFFS